MKQQKIRYPKLRFKGFSGEWGQRKFKNLYKKVVEKNDLSFGTERIISVANMYYKPNDSKSDEKYMETYNVFRVGDIAFEGHKSKNFSYGRFVENTIGDGIISHVFDVFRPISEYDLSYWKYFIHYEGIMGQKLRMSTTKATMMNNLVSKDFLKQSVLVPNLDEQKKIGIFLKQLDTLITLHQRKLDNLKKLKKSYLQKLFPKNGEKVPKLRFPGFTDAWEQRKVGDTFIERSERNKEGELISVTINFGVVKANKLNRKDNSSNDKSNYKEVKVGDIAYNSMRMWQGASGYSPYNGILSPAYTVITPKKGVYSKFFSYDFKRYDMIQTFKRNSQGLTSDTWNLKFSTLKSVKVRFPSFNEQQKISIFFQQFDNLITLQQCKLDKLKELKKAYLQQMFI